MISIGRSIVRSGFRFTSTYHQQRLQSIPEVVSKLDDFIARDNIHYFLAIGLIPATLLITYVNVTRGDSVLTEIPGGYDPEAWEYYKRPMTRLLTKYYYLSEEQIHEMNLHANYARLMLRRMNLLEVKVKKLMKERQDYKAWYYTPSPSEEVLVGSKQIERMGTGFEAHVGDVYKKRKE
ncbi:hypothetical protein ACOME3_002761 [Neoechinorhynchus agilis]